MPTHTKRINYDRPVAGTSAIEVQPDKKGGKVALVGLDDKGKPKSVVHVDGASLDELIQTLAYMQDMMGG